MNNINYLKGQLSKLMEKKNLDFVNQFFIEGKGFNKNLYHKWYFLSILFLEELESSKIEEFKYYYEGKTNGIYSVILKNPRITKNSNNLFELYILFQFSIIELYLNFDEEIDIESIFKYESPSKFSTEITNIFKNTDKYIFYINWYNNAYCYFDKYYKNKTDSFSKYFFNSDKLKEQSRQKHIDLSELFIIETNSYSQLSGRNLQQMIFLLETQYQYILTFKDIIEKKNSETKKIYLEMKKRNSRIVINKGGVY
jgi:hypothetical protein